jgi:hypothetical protein
MMRALVAAVGGLGRRGADGIIGVMHGELVRYMRLINPCVILPRIDAMGTARGRDGEQGEDQSLFDQFAHESSKAMLAGIVNLEARMI